MKQRLAKLKNSPYFRSSSIILVGAFFVNVLNYLFTLVVGRMLGPINYGAVASIFGLAAIIGVPAGAISMFMTKRVAGLVAKEDYTRLSQLQLFVVKNTLMFSLFLTLIYFLLLPLFAQFLRLDYLPLLIFGLDIPVALLLNVHLGSLQGFQDFKFYSLALIWGTFFKLVLAIITILLGWSVWGVVLVLMLSDAISYFYSRWSIRRHLPSSSVIAKTETTLISRRDVMPYLSIAFWATLLLIIITNIDVILAKHYLSADLAGQYAALSTIGKIIVYGVSAFITAMFPMVSASHSNGDGKGTRVLLNSLLVVAILSGVAIVIFWFLPNLVIGLLFGHKFLFAAPYLGVIGLAMLFISLTTVFVKYFVAIHEARFIFPLILSVLTQVYTITLFHDSVGQVVWSLVFSGAVMTLMMAGTYLYIGQKLMKA